MTAPDTRPASYDRKGYACGWNNGTLNSPLIYRGKHLQPGASAQARTARR